MKKGKRLIVLILVLALPFGSVPAFGADTTKSEDLFKALYDLKS